MSYRLPPFALPRRPMARIKPARDRTRVPSSSTADEISMPLMDSGPSCVARDRRPGYPPNVLRQPLALSDAASLASDSSRAPSRLPLRISENPRSSLLAWEWLGTNDPLRRPHDGRGQRRGPSVAGRGGRVLRDLSGLRPAEPALHARRIGRNLGILLGQREERDQGRTGRFVDVHPRLR